MRKTWTAFVGIFLLVSCKPAATPEQPATTGTTATISVPPSEPVFKLDHYKFWNVRPQGDKPLNIAVRLQGQFDKKPWNAIVQLPDYIGNPVEKRRGEKTTPIQNEKLHYLAYTITVAPKQPPPPHPALVWVFNQFNPKGIEWKLGDPKWLLVPADKKLDGKPETPPPGDHFVCYQAAGPKMQTPMTLSDQFDRIMQRREEIPDINPRYLCVPVSKEREGKPREDIRDPRTHLAIYEIKRTDFERRFWTNDQFGPQQLDLGKSEYLYLGVPSLKSLTPPK